MKSLFLLFTLASTSTFALTITCDVTAYNVQDYEFGVLQDVKRVIFSDEEKLSSYEKIYCNDDRYTPGSYRVKMYYENSFGELSEASQCENFEGNELSNENVIFSYTNDHDAPEEMVRLLRVNAEKMIGQVHSTWNTTESLGIVCLLPKH